jgi:polyisoprenoid-binding protein YceI
MPIASRCATLALAVLLASCRTASDTEGGTREEARAPQPSREALPTAPLVAPAPEGRVLRVIGEESLVQILVFRAGPLAKAGHNHVIASRNLIGTVRVAEPVERSSFELRIPAALLTVDEPELRASLGAEFPPEVPDPAREGTRRNMLSGTVLDAERHPGIVLRSERIERDAAGGLEALVRIELRDQARTLRVPFRFEMKAGELLARGDLSVRQTDLGLTPYSALLGALQVADELKVSVRVLAREGHKT